MQYTQTNNFQWINVWRDNITYTITAILYIYNVLQFQRFSLPHNYQTNTSSNRMYNLRFFFLLLKTTSIDFLSIHFLFYFFVFVQWNLKLSIALLIRSKCAKIFYYWFSHFLGTHRVKWRQKKRYTANTNIFSRIYFSFICLFKFVFIFYFLFATWDLPEMRQIVQKANGSFEIRRRCKERISEMWIVFRFIFLHIFPGMDKENSKTFSPLTKKRKNISIYQK